MTKVVHRQKATASMENDAEVASTPPVIRELKNYHPFSTTRAFRMSRIRRDSFVAEHRSIGVFTSGGDASGKFSAVCFRMFQITFVLKHYFHSCRKTIRYHYRQISVLLKYFFYQLAGL